MDFLDDDLNFKTSNQKIAKLIENLKTIRGRKKKYPYDILDHQII